MKVSFSSKNRLELPNFERCNNSKRQDYGNGLEPITCYYFNRFLHFEEGGGDELR